MTARARRPGRSLVALVATGAVFAALCSVPAAAAVAVTPARLPLTGLPAPSVLLARAQMAAEIGPGAIVQTDPYLGAVRWVANVDGTLTGPSALTPKDVALGFVQGHRKAFGLTLRDLALLRFRRDYVDILGTHHLSWEQFLGNRPLFGAGLKASVAADGALVTLAGPLDHVVRFEAAPRARLSAREALVASRRAAGVSGARVLGPRRPGEHAERVQFPTAGGIPATAWETITAVSPRRIDRSVIDARTGEVLWRENLVRSDQMGSGLAWPHAPGPFPNGGGVQAPVTFPIAGPEALSGNNAHVYTAEDGDDGIDPADEIPALDARSLSWSETTVLDTTTTSQNCSPAFPCTWDPRIPYGWKMHRRQEAVQAYYLLNVDHDHLASAPIGFTEAAGNFQVANDDGQGGRDGDPIDAATLVGADLRGNGKPALLNNSTMYAPPDGRPGLMSLYLFRRTQEDREVPAADAAGDASVIFHEYTHGLSARLVTMPDGSEALFGPQSGALSEGWSDWYALDALVADGYQVDTGAVDVPMGVWVSGGEGVRFQFADCRVGDADAGCPDTPGGAGPGGLTYADFGDVYTRPEVHSDGEIWLQTLWELRGRLGSHVTESLVTRAMEFSPQAPTFLDMRDAILVADAAANGGIHHADLWDVFAARGMGFFATVDDAFDVKPNADFSLPPTCPGPECGTLAGRIVDPTSGGEPVAGAVVRVAGDQQGMPVDRYAVSGLDGRFLIADVPDATYRNVEVALDGYATRVLHSVKVGGMTHRRIGFRRDWAALSGGAAIVGFTGPDRSGTSGECGPRGAVDGSLATSWLTSADEPRSLTIRLPQAVRITAFGIDPSAICAGAFADAKALDVWTRTEHGPWILAFRTVEGLPGDRVTVVRPQAGRSSVREIRLVLRSSKASPHQMEFTELIVRGHAAAGTGSGGA
jgi:extracellular elastinolytic metalloproteinase